MGDTRAPVAAHNAVPGGREHLIEVRLDALGDMFFGRVQSTGLDGAVKGGPLHVQGHVCRLYLEFGGHNLVLASDRGGRDGHFAISLLAQVLVRAVDPLRP